MPAAILDEQVDGLAKEMHRILFEMKWLLPWGTITNYNPTGVGGAMGSKPPAGVSFEGGSEEMPHEYWLRKWNQTVSTSRKEAVLQAAKKELDGWRKRPKVKVKEETREDFERRLIKDGQGWTVEDVARSFKCLPKEVRDIRRRHGAAVETGKIPRVLQSVDEGERARDLASNGMTERQIAMIVKLPKTTVRRMLGKAA